MSDERFTRKTASSSSYISTFSKKIEAPWWHIFIRFIFEYAPLRRLDPLREGWDKRVGRNSLSCKCFITQSNSFTFSVNSWLKVEFCSTSVICGIIYLVDRLREWRARGSLVARPLQLTRCEFGYCRPHSATALQINVAFIFSFSQLSCPKRTLCQSTHTRNCFFILCQFLKVGRGTNVLTGRIVRSKGAFMLQLKFLC